MTADGPALPRASLSRPVAGGGGGHFPRFPRAAVGTAHRQPAFPGDLPLNSQEALTPRPPLLGDRNSRTWMPAWARTGRPWAPARSVAQLTRQRVTLWVRRGWLRFSQKGRGAETCGLGSHGGKSTQQARTCVCRRGHAPGHMSSKVCELVTMTCNSMPYNAPSSQTLKQTHAPQTHYSLRLPNGW